MVAERTAWAQRMQFPSMTEGAPGYYTVQSQPYPGGSVYSQPYTAPSYTQPPAYAQQPAYSQTPAYGQAAPMYAAPPQYAQAPTYGQTSPVYPPQGYFQGQSAPPATLQGTIQPLNPGWDPYGTPGAIAAPAPIYPPQGHIRPDGTMAQPQRLIDEVGFEYTYISASGSRKLGLDVVDLWVSAAFPFFFNPAPLLVTPRFAVNYWNGPVSEALPGSPDLPPRTYDAELQASWKPVFTGWLSGDLAASIGMYTDFEKFSSDALRVRGHGLAVFTLSSRFAVAAGIDYINRNRIKLLPAGGVIWTPNPDTRWEIIFPEPRIARRFSTGGNTDWWGDVRRMRRHLAYRTASGAEDSYDYNDLRLILGLEWVGLTGLAGHVEVGYVFNRELLYLSGTPKVKPSDTVMLRAGLSF